MNHYRAKAALLLASGVLALWLGWIQYPAQPLSHGIGALAFVNQMATLIQNLDKDK